MPVWVAYAFQWLGSSVSNHWEWVQQKELGRITAVNDPTSPKHGVVARIEVRTGDMFWTGERAEVSRMMRTDPTTGKTVHRPVVESDGHEFYGLAIKLPPDWQSPTQKNGELPSWGIFLQLHGPASFHAPPSISLNVDDAFHIEMCGGDVLEGGTRENAKPAQSYPFTNGDLMRGHWVQFLMDVVWSYGNDGHLAIYRRDEGEKTFTKILELNNTPTLQYSYGTPKSEAPHHWKTGFYRSPTAGTPLAGMTNIIWLGPFVRGTSFDEVAQTAFGSP